MNNNQKPVKNEPEQPAFEKVLPSESERKFLAECEAAYQADPTALFTWDEVVAYIKRKR